MADICVKRLTKELMGLQKDPIRSPKITVAPNEDNLLEIHYVIEGCSDTAFEYGVYHGKLVFTKEYPMKPPSVIMMTPNGRFTPNRRLCLSMSDFHPETWNPIWGISTILTGLYSFMIESSPTLGSIETTKATKRTLAFRSLYHNCQDPLFCKLFPEYKKKFETIKAERMAARAAAAAEKKAALQQQQPSSSLSSLNSSFDGSAATAAGYVNDHLNESNGGVDVGQHHKVRDQGIQGMIATTAGVIAILSIVVAIRFL